MRFSTTRLLAFALACGAADALGAQAAASDTATVIRVHGFLDAYYAYDATRPVDGDRRYVTQPARHDEFNINLASLGVAVTRPHARATLTLQAGTSVQANYASEPRNGTTSGPELARHLQEAVVGVRVARTLWIDGGIYASYIGLEGWTSADNPTYTRSFVAEFSPYYLSGVKATWHASPKVSAQLHLTNGWQNISEGNRSKAVGARIDVAVTPTTTLSYANFLGNERPTGTRGAVRVFNQLMAKGTLPGGTEWQGQIDVGAQQGARWCGGVVIARHPLTPSTALVARLERYADPDQIIVPTALPEGFVANGASVGLDVALDGGARWRSELRTARATSALYPVGVGRERTRGDQLLTTSLSIGF